MYKYNGYNIPVSNFASKENMYKTNIKQGRYKLDTYMAGATKDTNDPTGKTFIFRIGANKTRTGFGGAQYYIMIDLNKYTLQKIKDVAQQNIGNIFSQLALSFTIKKGPHRERIHALVNRYNEQMKLWRERVKKARESGSVKDLKDTLGRKPQYPFWLMKDTYEDIFTSWGRDFFKNVFKFATMTPAYKRLKAQYIRIIKDGKFVNGVWKTNNINKQRLLVNARDMFTYPIIHSWYGYVMNPKDRLVSTDTRHHKYMDTGGIVKAIRIIAIDNRNPRKNKLKRISRKNTYQGIDMVARSNQDRYIAEDSIDI